MRAVVQRVSRAKVTINGDVHGEINSGLLALVAVRDSDTDEIMKWVAKKIANLRIFPDEDDKMNLSVIDTGGGILLISNFTLYGDPKKGFRPSYGHAAGPEKAEPMYDRMIEHMRKEYPVRIETGVFGAMMDLDFVNSGPVTIIIEKEA